MSTISKIITSLSYIPISSQQIMLRSIFDVLRWAAASLFAVISHILYAGAGVCICNFMWFLFCSLVSVEFQVVVVLREMFRDERFSVSTCARCDGEQPAYIVLYSTCFMYITAGNYTCEYEEVMRVTAHCEIWNMAIYGWFENVTNQDSDYG